MANIYISIVSHGHDELISSNLKLYEISQISNVKVVVKDNLQSEVLERFCSDRNYGYLSSSMKMGFGENNNHVFDHCRKIGMSDNDWFLCLNPDVSIDVENFERLSRLLAIEEGQIYTVNLFKDKFYKNTENSLRYFPNWARALNMLFSGSVTKAYDKNQLSDRAKVDWASGAFLIFRVGIYEQIGGFDRSFFMYYEDVDICYRAYKQYGYSVCFLKSVKAVHAGAYQNRNILSAHFRWYLKSLFLFLIRR